MNRLITTVLTAAGLSALGLALLATPASADANSPVRHLTGEWVGEGLAVYGNNGNFMGEQGRIVLKKAQANTVVANYQWRKCEPRPKKCQRKDPSGGGWSSKDRALFVINGSTITGVEDEALWDGEILSDGSILITFREMQNANPAITPMIGTYRMFKIS